MKLAEALLEKEFLRKRSELLQRRMARDNAAGRPTSHTQSELQRTANQERDISIAVDWTEAVSALSGLPLVAYRLRIKSLLGLAEAFEEVNPEKADEYRLLAAKDLRVFTAATWLIDLKIPGEDKEEN